MRILIVTHYFPPEIGAPQARLSELARFWSESGEEVTVLTGMPNHPTGEVQPGYRGRLKLSERVDGYKVERCWLFATPNEGFIKKTLGHLSFMMSSVMLGYRRAGRPDVVVVSSPTFFSILSGWVLARAKRARLVVEIRDLWPAIFVELGILKSRRIITALEWIELAMYRAADAIVVVSEGFREHIAARGIPEEKIFTVRNGVDVDRFSTATAPSAELRSRLGVTAGEILVLYIGAHGISQGLKSVADAAARLQAEPIHFALVGEGADKRNVEEHVKALGLENVSMLAGVPSGDVPDVLAAADICLVPLRDVPLFATFIPSKIFEYLAAGKPVVGAVAGEPAQILREAGATVVVPEDPAQLADAITALASNSNLRQDMGVRGRRYVETTFNRRHLADQYRSILRSVVGHES